MSGLGGRLLHDLQSQSAQAILVSGFYLSLTPMLCSRFLRHGKKRNMADSGRSPKIL
jgi:multidrug efflux pump subunit AcrB